MSRSYPIYNIITTDPERTRPPAFGAREGFTQDIFVGTSAKNSHNLATITVERRELPDGQVEFALYIDNTMLRRGILEDKEFTRENITELGDDEAYLKYETTGDERLRTVL